MNSNLRKDLVDSAWEQLWEKNLYEYLVGNQTAPPYCPPQAPCNCSGGGSGGGPAGPNGGGSGGGDGDNNAKDFYQNNPGLTEAVKNKLQGYTGEDRDFLGPARGPLTRDTSNDVKERFNARGETVSSGGSSFEPANNYNAGLEQGTQRRTSGAVGAYVKMENGTWSADYEVDPFEIADTATRMAKQALQQNREKNCDAPTGSGENPDTKDGPTDKTKSEGGDQSSNNKTRPVNNTGSNPKTGNSALGRLPVPKSSGTGSGVKK